MVIVLLALPIEQWECETPGCREWALGARCLKCQEAKR